jgi:hypothetical protein
VAPQSAKVQALARGRDRQSDSSPGTHPDFLVETTTGIRFFLELKSFEKDTILDKMDPGITVFSLGHMSLQKRANRLMKDAAKQLLPYACTDLPMVIGLDNYRQKGIGLDRDTLEQFS